MSAKLTDKQAKFVQEYLVDLNATQAAIRAGYSENTAQVIGSENLSKPLVSDAIAEARKEHAERCAVTIDSLTDELNEAIAMSRDQGDPNALRASIMSKAKIHGLEINVNVTDVTSSDGSMTPGRSMNDFYAGLENDT